jgi:hypothetical protein
MRVEALVEGPGNVVICCYKMLTSGCFFFNPYL